MTANHSEGGATSPLPPALRYLSSHSSSYRTIPSVPLPSVSWFQHNYCHPQRWPAAHIRSLCVRLIIGLLCLMKS